MTENGGCKEDDIVAMVRDINRAVGEKRMKLNRYESNFIRGIIKRRQDGCELTEPQDRLLEELWRKTL